MSRVLSPLVELATGMALGYLTASGSLLGVWSASVMCGILLVLLIGPSEIDPVRRATAEVLGRLPVLFVIGAGVLLLWSLGRVTGCFPLVFMGGWYLGTFCGLPGAGMDDERGAEGI